MLLVGCGGSADRADLAVAAIGPETTSAQEAPSSERTVIEGPPPPTRPEHPTVTASGVAWQRLTTGAGQPPTSADAVLVDYTCWAGDGAIFASTAGSGRSATFRMQELIPGLAEVLVDMRPGERRQAWVPANLAYAGRPDMPRGDLSYDLELLAVLSAPSVPPDVAGPPRGAVLSASGLAWRRLAAGHGDRSPTPEDIVSLHFSAWTTEGVLADSTLLRDHPVTIGVARTMPGMAEALEAMVVGERRRLWVPEDLAYRGRPGAPAGMLVVDVELLDLLELPVAPSVEVSAGAPTTASGLAHELLVAGTGARHPGPDSLVTLHFTGWLASGELHDSSLTRGQPSTVRVSELIPGWREGLQLMVEGETRRLWLPPELAFAGKPDQPQGPMVYDLELLAITD